MLLVRPRLAVALVAVTLGCAGCGSNVFTVAADEAGADASSSSEASTGTDAQGSDALEPHDAGLDALFGGNGDDGGPGTNPNPNLLQCGLASCDIGGGRQACCTTSSPPGSGSYEFRCVMGADECNAPPAGGTQAFMRCGGRPFCSGGECCLRRDQLGHFTTFCAATCPVEICAIGGPSTQCDIDEPCTRPASPTFDMLPGGYGSCGAKLP